MIHSYAKLGLKFMVVKIHPATLSFRQILLNRSIESETCQNQICELKLIT